MTVLQPHCLCVMNSTFRQTHILDFFAPTNSLFTSRIMFFNGSSSINHSGCIRDFSIHPITPMSTNWLHNTISGTVLPIQKRYVDAESIDRRMTFRIIYTDRKLPEHATLPAPHAPATRCPRLSLKYKLAIASKSAYTNVSWSNVTAGLRSRFLLHRR